MANEVKTVLTADASGFTADMLKAEKTTTEFGNSMTSAGSKAATLKGALRQATKEAMDLSLQMSKMSDVELSSDIGQQMQAQFQEALQAAANYKDQVADIQQEISNMASDTKAWDATAQGIGVLSSGLQGLASTYGLLGGDVRAFTQALTAVNAVQSIANTIVGIGNALQSQSALMVGLRAAKNAILGTSITAVTAAETANTVATTANTTATGAATTAQWALNAAVLANPYVACAVAIAALVGGLALWISSMDEATDSEIALGAAVDAFSEQVDSAMKTVSEQINLYDDLKRQYDACGGKTDEFSKKLIANTDVQKKLGVTVKTVDDVHKLFAKNSGAYAQACMARASAMAAEAAQAAILGATLSELSKIQAKLMAGQEVNWRDMRKVVESMGYSADAADKMMKAAGYVYEGEGMAYGNIQKGTGDLTKLVQEITKGGAYQALQDMADGFKQSFDTINEVDFGGMLTSNLNALDSTTSKIGKSASNAGKSASKAAKSTGDAVKKVLTSLEGCDAIIQQAEKDIKKLDSSTGDYQKKVETLKNTILMARVAKLSLLDRSTVAGLSEARKLISQIMQDLPSGSPTLEKMREELQKCDEQLYNMLNEVAKNGSLSDLKAVRSQIEKIIETLPKGSEELEKWAAKWDEINGKIKSTEREINNAKAGIKEGSPADLKQQIKELQDKLEKETDLSIRTELQLDIDNLKKQLSNIENKWIYEYSKDVMIFVDIETEFDENGTPYPKEVKRPYAKQDDYFYRDSQLQQDEKALDKLENRVKWLQEQIAHPEDVPDWGLEKVKEELDILTPELKNWRDIVRFDTITEDIKNFNKELGKTSYDNFKQGIDVMSTLYDSIANLPDKLDECEDGFEGFFAVMSAVFSLVDGIVSFIEGIEKMTEVIQMLAGAKEALTAAQIGETAANSAGTAATTAAAAAEDIKAGSDMAAVGASEAKAAALKAETASLLDVAAAQIFATHASIPFAGPSIAAGLVAEMMAAMAAAKAASMAMAAFEQGGIVKGSTTMGDNVVARLNAGEMVLNRGQQARLFRLINGGTIGTNSGELSGTIKVTGSDLYLALNNHKKITGKSLK